MNGFSNRLRELWRAREDKDGHRYVIVGAIANDKGVFFEVDDFKYGQPLLARVFDDEGQCTLD